MLAFILAPVLADIGDAIAAAAAILIPLAYVVRAILASSGGTKNQPTPPQRVAPRRVPPQQQGQPAGEQKKLVDEVEEFVRRAAERRRGAPRHEVEIVRPEPQPPKRAAARQPGATRERRPAVVVPTDEERLGRESVARHVETHLDTSAFEERGSHLSKVDDADELMEAHLSSVFDHEVGKLSSPSVAPTAQDSPDASASPSTAEKPTTTNIAALLASPANVRQAFVLQEVLRRPEEHW